MSSMEEGIRWATARIRELNDGVTIDGIQVRRKEGQRSWPVHAYIRFTDVEATEEALLRELTACSEEATESGTALHLRLVTLRGQVPASSRAVYIPAPEREATEAAEDTPASSSSAAGALVATNRDLRSLLEVFARQQGAAVSQAMQGWSGAMQRAAELEREAAELRAALVVAEQTQQPDPLVQQTLVALAPQLPMLLQNLSSARSRPE